MLSVTRLPRGLWTLLWAPLLLAGSLLGPTSLSNVHAEISACRTDPVVFLSNGVVVDLRADIASPASDVRQVTYTFDAPRGTEVLGIIKTPGLLGIKETVLVTTDNDAQTYDAETVVDTTTPHVAVQAMTTIAGPMGIAAGAAGGFSHQRLRVSISF